MWKAVLLFVVVCPFGGFAQEPRSSTTSMAMRELLREVAAYPRDDHQIRRTLALVVVSAMRLEELQRSGSVGADSFQTAFAKQLRTARAYLNLLGSNSLEAVRRDLAENLQRSLGAVPPVEHLTGAVADREGRYGESGPHIRDTIASVIQALRAVQDHPARQSAVASLLIEAAAVVRVFGDDPLALEGICHDLWALREHNRTPGT